MLLKDARFRNEPSGRAFLRGLARVIGTRNDAHEVSRATNSIGSLQDAELGFALLQNLDEGTRLSGPGAASDGAGKIQIGLYQAALNAATGGNVAETLRVEAIRVLAAVPLPDIETVALALVSPTESAAIQQAAIGTLARFSSPRLGVELTQRWGGMPAPVRVTALEALLSRAEYASALLDAMQRGRIRPDDLSPVEVAFLRAYPDGRIAQRANAFLPAAAKADRGDVVKRLLPVLQLRGNAPQGRQVYLARCAACHRFKGEGREFGPDLESTTGLGKEWMLTRFVNPSQHISPQAWVRIVETRHLGHLLGTLENETPAGINLRRFDGSERIALPRSALGSVTSLDISAMPEGLEAGLSLQSVADLLEYLAATPK
jgi:putative heme-binding domain-containing protein